MSDFPGHAGFSHTIVSTVDRKYGIWPLPSALNVSPGTYPSSDRAFYFPVLVPEPTIVTKLSCSIGSASSGNIDLGVYDEAGTRVVSTGSTAMGSASALQVIDVTDTLLTPGAYYLAVAVDNTTARLSNFSGPLFASCALMGIREQNSAFPLPATATFSDVSQRFVYLLTATTRIPVI
jgi:hypothetical protein